MNNVIQHEGLVRLADMLGISSPSLGENLMHLAKVESPYLKDLRINLSNALQYPTLTEKERALLAYAVAVNDRVPALEEGFRSLATAAGATEEELSETIACVSLLNVNNVFYRFRHFTKQPFYEQTPAGIKMNLMMKPVMGKLFFEMMSLVIAALNGCELCVNAHEESVRKHGATQEQVYEAVRLGAIIRGFTPLMEK